MCVYFKIKMHELTWNKSNLCINVYVSVHVHVWIYLPNFLYTPPLSQKLRICSNIFSRVTASTSIQSASNFPPATFDYLTSKWRIGSPNFLHQFSGITKKNQETLHVANPTLKSRSKDSHEQCSIQNLMNEKVFLRIFNHSKMLTQNENIQMEGHFQFGKQCTG